VRVFILLLTAYLMLLITSEYVLISDDLLYDFLGKQLSYERINELIKEGKNWKWLTYIFLPILILLKLFLVTVCLSIGTLILGIENSFKKLFQVVITAEFIFLISPIIKLFWFSLYQTDYTLENLQYFSPLSVFSLFNPTEIEPWLGYPLQLLNVFEFLYWLALAYLLKEVLGKSFSGSLGFVASTYGIGLLIWVVLVMFLTVSVS